MDCGNCLNGKILRFIEKHDKLQKINLNWQLFS